MEIAVAQAVAVVEGTAVGLLAVDVKVTVTEWLCDHEVLVKGQCAKCGAIYL